MESNTIEEKLNTEIAITSLKRELKNVTSQVSAAKNEYASTFSIIENNKKLIEEQRIYLEEIQSDISNAKLTWVSEREVQLGEIDEMRSNAQNILNRKAELNEQEEKIRQIEANDIKVRNETREIELKIEAEKKQLSFDRQDLDEREIVLKNREQKLLTDMKDFKTKVVKVIEEVEQL